MVDRRPDLSVVAPVYNEAGNVAELARRIVAAVEPVTTRFEVICVDDGSVDGTAEALAELHKADPRIRVISLSRNFGHQQALTAGLDHASGELIVTMDGDLQHPPELIPRLIEAQKTGFDIVNTERVYAAGTGPFKRATSSLFYRWIKWLSRTPIQTGGADFRLMTRPALDSLLTLRESERFLRGMVGWIGFRQTAVRFEAGQRRSGATKFSALNMLEFAVDGITSFSTVPLSLAIYLGLGAIVLDFFYLLWILYVALITRVALPGWASLACLVGGLGGIQLFCVGIMGKYIGRIFKEMKNRPIYIVRSSLGLDDFRRPVERGAP